jgi:hypothetical protein
MLARMARSKRSCVSRSGVSGSNKFSPYQRCPSSVSQILNPQSPSHSPWVDKRHDSESISLTMWRLSLLIIILALTNVRAGAVITDPIADYLSMNVPDRAENVGRLLMLKRVEVDMEGNGKPVVFVGTWYRKSGPNTWLWIAYAPIEGGFRRITDSDVLIDFAGIYVGPIPALHRDGLVQAYSLELDNQDRDQSNMISDLEYYFVDGDKLVQQGVGALDRDDPDQKATFDYFFGPQRTVSGSPKIISYSVGELVQRGYHLPAWASGH